jgi:hypothetical protein
MLMSSAPARSGERGGRRALALLCAAASAVVALLFLLFWRASVEVEHRAALRGDTAWREGFVRLARDAAATLPGGGREPPRNEWTKAQSLASAFAAPLLGVVCTDAEGAEGPIRLPVGGDDFHDYTAWDAGEVEAMDDCLAQCAFHPACAAVATWQRARAAPGRTVERHRCVPYASCARTARTALGAPHAVENGTRLYRKIGRRGGAPIAGAAERRVVASHALLADGFVTARGVVPVEGSLHLDARAQRRRGSRDGRRGSSGNALLAGRIGFSLTPREPLRGASKSAEGAGGVVGATSQLLAPWRGHRRGARAARAAIAAIARHLAPTLLHWGGPDSDDLTLRSPPLQCKRSNGAGAAQAHAPDEGAPAPAHCVDQRALDTMLAFVRAANASLVLTLPVHAAIAAAADSDADEGSADASDVAGDSERARLPLGRTVPLLLSMAARAARRAQRRAATNRSHENATTFPLLFGAVLGFA